MKIEGGIGQFRMGGMRVSHHAIGRVALVGETCHVFPPIGAQGLNLSLRDVADLEDCLASVDLTNPRELARGAGALRPPPARRHRVPHARRRHIEPLADHSAPAGRSHARRGFLAMTALGPLRRAVIREGVLPHFLLPRLMRGKPPSAERPRRRSARGEVKMGRHANGRRFRVPICSPLLYEMPHRNTWRPCRVPFAPR